LAKRIIWGRALAENVRIPSYMRERSKIAQKYVIWYLNVPLCSDSKQVTTK